MTRSLTVVSVAYPLAPVSVDAVGGAEQVLATLDRGLVEAGHRSIVVAMAGSRTCGELVATPQVQAPLDEAARAAAQARHRATLAAVLAQTPVDLVHLHGHDFERVLPDPGPPVLVTLHVPHSWYAPEAFTSSRSNTWFNTVSDSQRCKLPELAHWTSTIENGVDLEHLRPLADHEQHALGQHALALGRICPDKGFHRALEAAHRADAELLLAGEVFAYPDHQRYFTEAIQPRLDGRRRFIGPIGRERKRELLATARCLLVPSEVEETSSLVAREALACGTPVVTFGAGALTEVVAHGRTGFIVRDEAEMAAAIERVDTIDRRVCREVAERRFSDARMIRDYLDLYARIIGQSRAQVES